MIQASLTPAYLLEPDGLMQPAVVLRLRDPSGTGAASNWFRQLLAADTTDSSGAERLCDGGGTTGDGRIKSQLSSGGLSMAGSGSRLSPLPDPAALLAGLILSSGASPALRTADPPPCSQGDVGDSSGGETSSIIQYYTGGGSRGMSESLYQVSTGVVSAAESVVCR